MENDNDVAEAADPATAAFLRLEREIALMRRAVERLASEKADIAIPDYSETLGEMSQHLGAMVKALKAILAKPAMELTPDAMAQRMNDAASKARQADEARIDRLRSLYNGTIQELRGIVASAYVAADQRERISWAAGGGVLAGCLLWSILPGAIARALPDSWHMPEKIAARVLREPSIWEGGVRLLRVGSPEAWRAISSAAEMRNANFKTIDLCEKAASRSKRPTRCTIEIKPLRSSTSHLRD